MASFSVRPPEPESIPRHPSLTGVLAWRSGSMELLNEIGHEFMEKAHQKQSFYFHALLTMEVRDRCTVVRSRSPLGAQARRRRARRLPASSLRFFRGYNIAERAINPDVGCIAVRPSPELRNPCVVSRPLRTIAGFLQRGTSVNTFFVRPQLTMML